MVHERARGLHKSDLSCMAGISCEVVRVGVYGAVGGEEWEGIEVECGICCCPDQVSLYAGGRLSGHTRWGAGRVG